MSQVVDSHAPPFLSRSAWRLGMTLAERADMLRAAFVRQDLAAHRVDRGQRRLAQWRAQAPFTSESLFHMRLRQVGLTEQELLELLSEPPDAEPAASIPEPTWAETIDRAFARSEDFNLAPLLEAWRDSPEIGFLNLVAPLLHDYLLRLREGMLHLAASQTTPLFDPPTVERTLFRSLSGKLLELVQRSLVLELHATRLRGLLTGDTPEQRFDSFLRRLERPEVAREFFHEYPVLARLVVSTLEHWLAASLEFLRRWRDDWPAIRDALCGGADPGPLVEVQGNAGDTHRGGRSVWIACCASGFRVVYKPKSLAVDQHFQELQDWLTERGLSVPFRRLQILDRGAYGWEEFVAGASCSCRDEVARFYRRTGSYLALLYALAATDFHQENVIAAAEHPVLIDLEALFHPCEPLAALQDSDRVLYVAFDDGVLSCGLLPQRFRHDDDDEWSDLSGIGAEAGTRLPFLQPGFSGKGADEMRFVRGVERIQASSNRPMLNGSVVSPLDFLKEIEAGFTEAYGLLERHRGELLGPEGPLRRFSADEVRVIFRQTSRYAELLFEGTHPDVLRDALERDRLFDRLWDATPHWPHRAAWMPSEGDALWQGDIPLFTTRPESHDLWDASGARWAGVFPESGLECAQRRLERLSAGDLDQQLWFLRASLTTLARAEGEAHVGYDLDDGGPSFDGSRALAAARAVGDRLAERALRGGSDINWIGLSFGRDRHWSLGPIGLDLYDGLPGVGLFLGYLGFSTNDDRYTTLSHAVVQSIRRTLQHKNRQKAVREIGAFTGWGGVLYVYAHLGVLWNDRELLAEAESLVDALPNLIEDDQHLDVVGGAAGCIAGLLSLQSCAPSTKILAAAELCGDRLLTCAKRMTAGLGWGAGQFDVGPLTGFSHGAAGIAWALAKLAATTGAERFRSAAQGGIAYERSLFSAERGAWADLRRFSPPSETSEAPFQTAWCHGAAGIGMSRLECMSLLDDPGLKTEIDAALRTTRASGFGLNHGLCHGDLGNLDFLLRYAQAFPESPWQEEWRRLASGILNDIADHGWRCSNPLVGWHAHLLGGTSLSTRCSPMWAYPEWRCCLRPPLCRSLPSNSRPRPRRGHL